MSSVLQAVLVVVIAAVAVLAGLGLWLRSLVRRRVKRYTGVLSAHLDWWLWQLLRKGEDRSALFIQDREKTRSIQIENYGGPSGELVWIFVKTESMLPYLDRFLAEVTAAGWRVSPGEPRSRRHPCLEVRMGQDFQRVRKLVLRTLQHVYEVQPQDCHVLLLNVPDAAEPTAMIPPASS